MCNLLPRHRTSHSTDHGTHQPRMHSIRCQSKQSPGHLRAFPWWHPLWSAHHYQLISRRHSLCKTLKLTEGSSWQQSKECHIYCSVIESCAEPNQRCYEQVFCMCPQSDISYSSDAPLHNSDVPLILWTHTFWFNPTHLVLPAVKYGNSVSGLKLQTMTLNLPLCQFWIWKLMIIRNISSYTFKDVFEALRVRRDRWQWVSYFAEPL